MSTTRWKLYTGNEEIWEAMLAACEKATKSIDLEQFIFVDDAVGKRFIDVCTQKAADGVRVRFLWDAAGSFSFFGSTLADDLKKKGIKLIFFKTLVPGFFNVHNYRSWYFRNHRRSLVIDGEVGFTGSICMWQKTANWRDMQVEVEGHVVAEMADAFQRMWDRASGKKLLRQEKKNRRKLNKKKREYIKKYSSRDTTEFIYETNSPIPKKRFMYYRLIEVIRAAEKSVYITTPYFVPTRKLSRIIRLAAHRGVDVRIIIPKASDKLIVDIAAQSFFQDMLDAGVKIYRYTGGTMLHSKATVVDGKWASVGSLNIDTVSLLYNFEANITSVNTHFVENITTYFFEDLAQSEEVDRLTWQRRPFILKTPEIVVKLFRKFL
ncbi:MAG: phospholipase D-like domain-containing protein [bacterium]